MQQITDIGDCKKWKSMAKPNWDYCLTYGKPPSKHLSLWRRIRLDQDEDSALVICLEYIFNTFSRLLQDVLKTFERRLEDNLRIYWQEVFSSKPLQGVLKRCPQDVFKTNYQVELLLLTRLQEIYETHSARFWDILRMRLSTERLA